MVYRENEMPKWRHITITHYDAAEILKSEIDYSPWESVGDYKVIPAALLSRAVAIFLNRLQQSGVDPKHVKVVFHPEKPDKYATGDRRSSYSIFYFGIYRVSV